MLGETKASVTGKKAKRPSKQELLEYVGIGAIAGATAATVNLGIRGVADVGDLLGFVGAAVGAGLAVIGAIYVEERKRSNDLEATRSAIDRMLEDYIRFVDARAEDVITISDLPSAQLVAEVSADRLDSMVRYCYPKMAAMADPDAVHCAYWLETDGAAAAARLRDNRNKRANFEALKGDTLSFYAASKALTETILQVVQRSK